MISGMGGHVWAGLGPPDYSLSFPILGLGWIRMGIIVNFSRGPAFRPHRDIRGIARLCTASLGTGPPARRPRSDRCGS